MKVNESKEKELNLVSGAIRTSQRGIRFTKENLNTLNMGNEEAPADEDYELYEGFPCVDPAVFLDQKETMLWDRLSKQEQEVYIREGVEAAENAPEEGGSAAVFCQDPVWQEEFAEQPQGYSPVGQEMQSGREGKSVVGRIVAGRSGGQAGRSGGQAEGIRGTVDPETTVKWDGVQQNATDRKSEGLEPGGSFSYEGTVSENLSGDIVQRHGNIAENMGQGGMSFGSSAAAQAADAGMSGTGIGFAVSAGKKAAESFRDSVEAQALVSNQIQQRQQTEDAAQSWNPLPDSAIVKGGAAVIAALTALASTLVQAVTSFLTSIVSSLLSVVVTLVSIVSLTGVLAVLFITILVSNTNNNGAEQIVQVALAEEGTTDGSEYWQFVVGSQFIDGNSTPWCACFVSWCAEQCGFIEDGIFPRSASVAVYEAYYRQRNLYVESGDYIPRQGDLIIFGSDEHIGIVQYTEGGRVITIEGNTSDAVHSRSYALTSSYISGYCTPAYPQNADFSGNTNDEIAYNYLRSMGCTREAAVSVVANLKAESGVDPNCYQYGGGPGRGICQWEVGGGRYEALVERAESEGKQWNDLEVQLEFMWYEFTGGDATCRYILNRDYGGIENFKNSTDIAWAVEAFERSFERAGSPAIERRTAYALEYYEQFAE